MSLRTTRTDTADRTSRGRGGALPGAATLADWLASAPTLLSVNSSSSSTGPPDARYMSRILKARSSAPTQKYASTSRLNTSSDSGTSMFSSSAAIACTLGASRRLAYANSIALSTLCVKSVPLRRARPATRPIGAVYPSRPSPRMAAYQCSRLGEKPAESVPSIARMISPASLPSHATKTASLRVCRCAVHDKDGAAEAGDSVEEARRCCFAAAAGARAGGHAGRAAAPPPAARTSAGPTGARGRAAGSMAGGVRGGAPNSPPPTRTLTRGRHTPHTRARSPRTRERGPSQRAPRGRRGSSRPNERARARRARRGALAFGVAPLDARWQA